MTKASLGVLFAGKFPSLCSLSVLSAILFHLQWERPLTGEARKRSQEALQVLHKNKMAAAFPSERSTKDVINNILDDYEKLTKQVSFPFLSLFCSVRCKCSEIKMVNPDSGMIDPFSLKIICHTALQFIVRMEFLCCFQRIVRQSISSFTVSYNKARCQLWRYSKGKLSLCLDWDHNAQNKNKLIVSLRQDLNQNQ